MSHFKPVPAPRIKISVDLNAPPPIPPKPREGILRKNSERSNLNLNIPLAIKRGFNDTSIKPSIVSKPEEQILKGHYEINNLISYIPSAHKTGFNSSTIDRPLPIAKPRSLRPFRNTVGIRDPQQKPIAKYDVTKELLSPLYLPPPVPPRPKPVDQRSSFTSKLNVKKQEEKNTVIAETKHLENITYELENFSKTLLNSELQYIEKLEEALEISKELQSIDLAESVVTKFFGLLKDIHTLHKEIFYKDLNQNMNNPKALLHCFLKHEVKFSVYIERQWLVLKKFHLTEFEKFIIEERGLMQYIKISRERIMDYIKILTYIKPSIQNAESETDDIFLINEAIRVVENVCYQLEMTEKLQSIENIRNRFKECGEVYLHDTFKISINGSKRQKCQVYFCKNLILFAKVEENGNVHYYDDILVSDSYCVQKSKSKNVFEIRTKSRNRYILKSDLQITTDEWCERLKEVLTFNRYTDISSEI